jgi:AAA ATPase domain
MEIILENFRSFVQRQSIPITPLTFLVGENSSGKSTFMAALSAIDRQVFYDYKPQLNDPPYDLGSFDTIATYKGGRYGRAEYFVLGSKTNTPSKDTSVLTIFKEDRGQPVFWKIEIIQRDGSITMELEDQAIKGEISLPSLLNQPYEFSRPFPFSRKTGSNAQAQLFEPFEPFGNWYTFLMGCNPAQAGVG